MQFDREIQQALRDVYSLLMANVVVTRNLSDERAVVCLRATTSKLEVRNALQKANDTAACFALREVTQILANRQQTPRATIERLWQVVRQPDFSSSFGFKKDPSPIL
jgi:hypothetical protein